MSRHELLPGETLIIGVGPYDLTVVRDRRGHLGIADARGCWMPPPDPWKESDALGIMTDHAAYSDHGTGAEAIRDSLDVTTAEDPGGSVHDALRMLWGLACRHPALPALLLIKVFEPELTLRELAKRAKFGHSETASRIAELAERLPALAGVLGKLSKGSRGQQGRRKRERD